MPGRKTKFFIEAIFHVLFWIAVYYAFQTLIIATFKMEVRDNGHSSGYSGRSRLPYCWVTFGALILLFYGNIFLLYSKAMRTKIKLVGVAIVSAFAVVVFMLNYEVIRKLVAAQEIRDRRQATSSKGVVVRSQRKFSQLTIHPGPQPDSSREQVVESQELVVPPPPAPPGFSPEDWNTAQPIVVAIFLAIVAVSTAYFFIKEWLRNDLMRSRAEAERLGMELRFLRSQVNPHFFFNTLNNLFSMAKRKGNEDLADSILKLSGIMRYMLYEGDTDFVPLHREIAYLEDSIALHKLRFADGEVSVSFRHPGPAETVGIQVASMLFVPFLENAFKHGVAIGYQSSIMMSIAVDSRRLLFTCENTDHSRIKKLEDEGKGIGLENIRRRLELLYPGRYELQTARENERFKVNLQIELA
ncbi:MAG TPA: sensor histidine kinase [Puia sp.]|nr:sensor histidine kinase [Puia sp.]